jgi:hypothetical protein
MWDLNSAANRDSDQFSNCEVNENIAINITDKIYNECEEIYCRNWVL